MITYPIRRTPRGKCYMTVGDRCCYDTQGVKRALTTNILASPIIGYTTCLAAWQRGNWKEQV